jgi:hypothetical protein
MTKIVIESGLVLNLGGYFVERRVEADFIDVVVGNPLEDDVKINAPILSREMLDEIREKGLIVEYIHKGDSLKDKLEEVREKVGRRGAD